MARQRSKSNDVRGLVGPLLFLACVWFYNTYPEAARSLWEWLSAVARPLGEWWTDFFGGVALWLFERLGLFPIGT